jgi:cyanophycinase
MVGVPAMLVCLPGDAVFAADRMPPDSTAGSLLIIGGSARTDNQEIWAEMIRLSGGTGKRIAVIPTASGVPLRSGNRTVSFLNSKGADAFLVPAAAKDVEPTWQPDVAQDASWAEVVRASDGVFFLGGSQGRIRDTLVDAQGRNTPLLDAIWDVYRRGGLVAGSSAGAAIMSQVMIREAGIVLNTMINGVKMGKELDHGLGFLAHDWFVDQHCLVRGRFARSLVAMHSQSVPFGVGIDEDTALVVEKGTQARVVGYRGAIVMDLSEARSDEALGSFNVQNARLTYLDRGDMINLSTREVTPSTAKAERKIDPRAPGFRPSSGRKLFFNDILANTTVLDVMRRIIDHSDGTAVGLAFDGSEAREGSTIGFEFRFYRESDSLGWETEIHGATDMTIQNIHLDIRPVRIQGPLYTEYTKSSEAVATKPK